MKNKYEYIVSYNFRGGVGTFNMTASKPINSLKYVDKIKRKLETEHDLYNVALNSYTLVSKKIYNRKFIK